MYQETMYSTNWDLKYKEIEYTRVWEKGRTGDGLCTTKQ
jgi:hypothetical protein